jgi:hypothetical protein
VVSSQERWLEPAASCGERLATAWQCGASAWRGGVWSSGWECGVARPSGFEMAEGGPSALLAGS